MAFLRIAAFALGLIATQAHADSFFWLTSGPFPSGGYQWISSDAPAGRPDFGRIQMPSWLPRQFKITGCRAAALPNDANNTSAFWVQLSLAIDHLGRSFASGNPNVPGGQTGADFSHNDTLCVTGFEWGKFSDKQEFMHSQLFNRDAGDLLWLTLGTAAQDTPWVYFQINWDPITTNSPATP